VRWERLFADLEAQYDAAQQAELAGEVADRSRREIAQVRLADRLSATDGEVQVGVAGTDPVRGTVVAHGPDWLLVGDDMNETLVLLDAVSWVRGLSTRAEPSRSAVAARLGLGHALRGLARDRAETTVVLRTGEQVIGTIDRVGADFVDLAEHPPGEPPRAGAVRATRTIGFAALAALSRR
jgi:hypothetical protein